jgi:hypothetical protein
MSNEIMYEIINGELVEVSEASKAQIISDREEAIAITTSNAYAIKRVAEYPPITDYIDGVVKGDQAQIDKYIADCLAVKAKYPKE